MMRKIFLLGALTAMVLIGCDSQQQEKQPVSVDPAKTETAPVIEPVVSKPAATESVSTEAAPEVKTEPVITKVEAKAEMTGDQVYNKSCVGCHASGAAGAPKLGDAAAWKARVAKGLTALYSSAAKGVPGTAMMAKGTCVACSDAELNAAVDYMISKVK